MGIEKTHESADKSEKSRCDTSAQSSITSDLIAHWNKVYANSKVPQLGWYEEDPEPSMRLINLCNLDKSAALLNVGAGATTLIDVLINQGFDNIIANDLSSNALDKLKVRLGRNSDKVKWIIDDLTCSCELEKVGEVDLWHDRAVLHFFVEKEKQDAYCNLLRRLVKKAGFVIIAAFNLEGAEKCSGLPVYRYDEGMLQERLGSDFELVESFDYKYIMPSGDLRDYVYTLFKRIK